MAYTCVKCNNAVYIGSRLSEDAYYKTGVDENGFDVYEHYKCGPYLYELYCKQCLNSFKNYDENKIFCDWFCEEEYNKEEY